MEEIIIVHIKGIVWPWERLEEVLLLKDGQAVKWNTKLLACLLGDCCRRNHHLMFVASNE